MKPAHVINVEESRKAEVGGQRSDVRNWKAESGNRKGAGSRAASRSTLDPGHSTLFFLFALLLLVPIASGLPPKPAKSPAKAANAQPVPVARWTFDNEVGGEFPATGSGIPLKKSGGIEVVAGRSSNALQFGAPGVAEIEQSMGDLVSNQFTVMFWIQKTKEAMNSDGYASLFDAGGRDGVGITIKQHKSIGAITSGVNNYLWNAKRLPEGEWVQIACTFDGDKTVFYVNGEALENPPDAMGSKKTQNFGSKMTVGSTAFNGAIDDLRIYDTALTPEQITAAEND